MTRSIEHWSCLSFGLCNEFFAYPISWFSFLDVFLRGAVPQLLCCKQNLIHVVEASWWPWLDQHVLITSTCETQLSNLRGKVECGDQNFMAAWDSKRRGANVSMPSLERFSGRSRVMWSVEGISGMMQLWVFLLGVLLSACQCESKLVPSNDQFTLISCQVLIWSIDGDGVR